MTTPLWVLVWLMLAGALTSVACAWLERRKHYREMKDRLRQIREQHGSTVRYLASYERDDRWRG